VPVSYWPYAYPTDRIVAGLIAPSGDVFSFPVNNPELAAKNWYNASALFGCGANGDVMGCMRNLDFEDIKAAAAKVLLTTVKQGRSRLSACCRQCNSVRGLLLEIC
jgi:cholinesterase